MYYNTVMINSAAIKVIPGPTVSPLPQSEYLTSQRQGIQNGTEIDATTDHLNFNVATGSGQAFP